MGAPTAEFPFELRACLWAETGWPPTGDRGADRIVLVGRQVGTAHRRWDTVVIECDPDGLARRGAFGPETLDGDLLDVLCHAPADWAYYRDALAHPGYPWRYVRESIHRAADRDLLETRRRSGRIEIRRRFAYPDWVDRVIAIENKPDLDASAARDLQPQLEHDVALALADEVWVATACTGEAVPPVLLEDLPVAAGVLELDPTALEATVCWNPRRLPVEEPGTRILENPAGGPHDASAARFEYVEPAAKRETRLAIAERVYGRGWRSYVEAMRPDCRHFELRAAEGFVPHCGAKDRVPTARECAGRCPAFEPEPPAWRQHGWPIEGGPGKAYRRVLDRQRRRQRPGLVEDPDAD